MMKIMTAIIAIENGDIDSKIEVGDEVLKAYGSAIYIEVGEQLTLKDLLIGLMLRSGNDAAIVIAKNVAGDMDKFADLMNKKAKEIGMNNSIFYNAHGLENNDGTGNLSTARDMALLTKYAMKNPVFREIFGTKNYKVKTNYKTYVWTNKNKLLHRYDYITGGKTGFTIKARRTLVTTASNNNINLVAVTLNDGNDFQDHITLYETVFKNYTSLKVLDKKLHIKQDNKYQNVELYLNDDIYIPVTNNEEKNIHINYELYDLQKYNDKDNVGKVKIFIGDELVREEKIYVSVPQKEKISLWQKIKRWLKW